MKTLKFVCPKCKHNVIEEIMENASISSNIKTLTEDGATYAEDVSVADGDVVCYQCGECGYILRDNDKIITTIEEVIEWCKSKETK